MVAGGQESTFVSCSPFLDADLFICSSPSYLMRQTSEHLDSTPVVVTASSSGRIARGVTERGSLHLSDNAMSHECYIPRLAKG